MSLSYLALPLLLLAAARAEDTFDSCSADPFASGPWSCLLEEWAISSPVENDRQGRVMSLPPAPGYYVTDRVDLPPPPLHMGPPPRPTPPLPGVTQGAPDQPHSGPMPGAGPVPYAEWQPPSGPGKVVNKPSPHKDKPFKPSPSYPTPPNQNYQQSQQYQPQYQQPQYQQPQYQPPQHQPPQYQQPPQHQQSQYQQLPQHQSPQYQNPPLDPHRGPGPMPPRPSPAADRIDEPPRKQVTETDLYLLSAIEKLVYRVDLMEKRLRKLEENVHLLVVGVEHKPEPCVSNFTRVGGLCYHFSTEAVDWKSANLRCRKLRGHLLELDSDQERRTMFSAMLADKKIRGMDVWTGGLNPGLLWIWSHSARPVLSNSTTTSAGATTANSNVTIVGNGRCLAAVHDAALNNYVYRGQDCSLRHRFICEKDEDKTKLSNEIERVARGLKQSTRQARLLLTDRLNSP